MKSCSLNTFRSHCHTGWGLLAWSLHRACVRHTRSEAVTGHVRVALLCPRDLSPSPRSIRDIWGLALGVVADPAVFECAVCAV